MGIDMGRVVQYVSRIAYCKLGLGLATSGKVHLILSANSLFISSLFLQKSSLRG